MIALLPLLLGLASTPQPIYAALTTGPTALRVLEDELIAAAGESIVRFTLKRGVMLQRHRVATGPVLALSGWDPLLIDTADGRWRWSPGAAPEKQAVSAGPARREVVQGKVVWRLDAQGAVVRDGRPLAAIGATDLLSLGGLGVLAVRRGARATGEGDLVRFDLKGVERWRSKAAPKPTAATFDPKRSAIWVGTPSGAIDRWRVDDGQRFAAIPSGRSEPIRCVASAGDAVLVGDVHGGIWLWSGRDLAFGHRFPGVVRGLSLSPAPEADVEHAGRIARWRLTPGKPPAEVPRGAPLDCTAPRFPEADGSLLHAGVRYVVRADGHWRSESTAGVKRGRTTPRRDR